jgi:hypothetical protein
MLSEQQTEQIERLKNEGESPTVIAKTVGCTEREVGPLSTIQYRKRLWRLYWKAICESEEWSDDLWNELGGDIGWLCPKHPHIEQDFDGAVSECPACKGEALRITGPVLFGKDRETVFLDRDGRFWLIQSPELKNGECRRLKTLPEGFEELSGLVPMLVIRTRFEPPKRREQNPKTEKTTKRKREKKR